MSNNSTHTRTRHTHRTTVQTRRTHGPSGFLGPIEGASEVYEQILQDGTVGPGDIPPGTVPGPSLVAGSLPAAAFAADIRPVAIVPTLPTLPDPLYPPLSYVVLTSDSRLYKNIANVWVKGVDGADIVADSITAGQIAAGAVSTSELAVGARLTGEVANETGGSPGVFIDSSGILIRDGKLVLKDEFATTVMMSSGFSGAWSDFIQLGVYNARFLLGTVGVVPNGRTVALPYWTVSNVVGTPTATFISGGGVKTTFGALNHKKRYVTDLVPVRPDTEYFLPLAFEAVIVAGAIVVDPYVEWFQGDGVTAATPAAVSPAQTGAGVTTTVRSVDLGVVRAGTDAYFARVRLDIYQDTTHNAGNSLTLRQAGLMAAPLRNLNNAPAPGWVWTMDQLEVVTDVGITGQLLVSGLENHGGTSFPGSPASTDQFYRTDLGMWFQYDGTRWMSSHPYLVPLTNIRGLALPLSATQTGALRGSLALPSGFSDIMVQQIDLTFIVNSGGTALSGSHHWVISMVSRPAVGPLDSQTITDIASGASGAWRMVANSFDDLAAGDWLLSIDCTKVGTPGTLEIMGTAFCRLVAV